MSESDRDLPEGEQALTESDVDETAEAVEASTEAYDPDEELLAESDNGRRRMPLLALLALLLAASALLGGGYAWQRMEARITELQRNDSTLLGRVDERLKAGDAAVARLDEQLAADRTARDAQLARVEEGLRGLRSRIAQDADHWVLAEVEYLLQLAIRRLELAGDVDAADVALVTADTRLRELADPDMLAVREAIADGRNALRAVPRVDIDGLALSLRSLAKRADQLPTGGARYRPGQGGEVAAGGARDTSSWRSVLGGIWNQIKGLVQIRHEERALQPLMSADQEYLVYQNLRIQLDAARLALLRGSQGLYTESLRSAREWIDLHFETGNSTTQAMLGEIDRLQRVQIAPDLPDLGGPLRSLREARAERARRGNP